MSVSTQMIMVLAHKQNIIDETSDKQLKRRGNPNLYKHGFKAGESGNPLGRPKGSRSRFSETFCQDVIDDWEKNGASVLAKVREEDPATYLRVAASLVPKEFKLTTDESTLDRFLDGLGNDELEQLLNGLKALGASGQDRKKIRAPITIDQPTGVHKGGVRRKE